MDGVMFITSHDKTVALDAVTGKEIWKTMVAVSAGDDASRLLRHRQSRRRALSRQVLPHLLDGRVQALDAKTGKEIWNTRSGEIAERPSP